MTNALGQEEEFVYDNNDRLVQKINKDGTQIQYGYDLTGRLTQKGNANFLYYADAKLKQASNQHSTTFMTYDLHRRPQSVQESHAGTKIVYTYDARGLTASMTLTSATNKTLMTVAYQYNERKLPIKMTANMNGMNLVWEQFYDELGRPVTEILPNGVTVTRQYDASGRLNYLSNETEEGKVPSRFEYTHSPVGNITEIIKTFTDPKTDSIGREVLSYTYDQIDRLTSASGEGLFVYDAVGNHLQYGGQYNSLNQIESDDRYIYSHSTNGNLTSKVSKVDQEETLYSWDNENRLVGVAVKDVSNQTLRQVSYKYDGLENRIEKNSSGIITKYAYNGDDLIAELTSQNREKALYLHGPGIDNPIVMWRDLNSDQIATANEFFFYTKDHLNSVHELTDIDGKLVQRYFYKAYGETKVLKATRSRDTEVLVENPFAFNSREWEREGEIYCHRARCRDPRTGRWLSPDPIGFKAGDPNIYRYVKNNPLVFKDPQGKDLEDASGAVGDFWNNYWDMRNKNIKNSDKYFHCMANCQASSRGDDGLLIAEIISEMRENVDERIKKDSSLECQQDREANFRGQVGGSLKENCANVCSKYVVKGLH